MKPLLIDPQALRFQALIGTGGVGSGMFFALDGNQTLGREESRSGRLLDQRDYCKLHIISHYVKVLLGEKFPVFPVSKLGEDETGWQVLAEMDAIGLDTRFIERDPVRPTMFSFCFLYPDGSGGNLTSSDSACGRLEADFIRMAEPAFGRYEGRGLALATPEVPLSARETLLRLGTKHRFYRAASFTSVEIPVAVEMGLLALVDLLAINLDEAAALLDTSTNREDPESIAKAAFDKLQAIHPRLSATITASKQGSWAWDGQEIHCFAALPVCPVSTAGAGDAFFAGILTGLTAGLPLFQAQELGTLVAACSVTSPHTIHPALDRDSLEALVQEIEYPLSGQILSLLGM